MLIKSAVFPSSIWRVRRTRKRKERRNDCKWSWWMEMEMEMFYLTTHSTHFIYGYMASDIWLRTILIVRKETRCRHIGYSFRLAARVLLYAPSHRQDSTYHGLCYTSRGALAGTRNSSMGPPHEGSIRRPIAPWANALTTELHLAPWWMDEWSNNAFKLINGLWEMRTCFDNLFQLIILFLSCKI